jgi:hypothetical protein
MNPAPKAIVFNKYVLVPIGTVVTKYSGNPYKHGTRDREHVVYRRIERERNKYAK